MGLVSEVKCARCDRNYSGVRSRCPYCGARRIGRGKYSPEVDDSKGKMLVGILIMAVLVVAVGVLLITSRNAEKIDPDPEISNSESPSETPPGLGLGDDTDVSSVTSSPLPSPSPEPTEPSAPVVAAVESFMITYNGVEKTEYTMKTTETPIQLALKIVPADYEGDITWESSDTSVFDVVPNDTTGLRAKTTPIGTGNATLTVTVGDITRECKIFVRKG